MTTISLLQLTMPPYTCFPPCSMPQQSRMASNEIPRYNNSNLQDLTRRRNKLPTERQRLGAFGEMQVVRSCSCPKCNRPRTFVRLPTNFKCADVICDFCGFLAQVKTTTVQDISMIPIQIMGAAWKPQRERMEQGIIFPLFLVLSDKGKAFKHSIFYLAADHQSPEMFVPRNPLGPNARRAGWTGFNYNLNAVHDRFERKL